MARFRVTRLVEQVTEIEAESPEAARQLAADGDAGEWTIVPPALVTAIQEMKE